jgi:YVTN family beta-propeller protein
MKKAIRSLFLLLLFVGCSVVKKEVSKQPLWIASSPSGDEITKIDKIGITVLPNGRLVTPSGKNIMTAPHPYGLTLSPDGKVAVTANSGTNPLSITIVRDIMSDQPEVQQVPPGPATDKGVLASVFMGLAIAPDNQTIYVAGGQENKVYLFDVNTGAKKDSIDCSFTAGGIDYSHGYIGDMKMSKDGKTLYAVDQIGFRMVIMNTKTRTLIHSVPVGRYPFGICLSPDEKKAYVANVGMFEYNYMKDSNEKGAKIKSIDYPAFAYGSKEMQTGIQNDTIAIIGLGELNAIEAFSIFAINIEDTLRPKVIAKIKTGNLVGALVEGIPAVGGSSPNSIVATDDYVLVSNGTNDNISVISIAKDTVIHTIPLKLDSRVKQFRGVIPFGLALSPDQKRLYVAESGINAVAVINVADQKVLGHIPTGWFPSKIEVSRDGKKLIIANAKGFGSGPNGGAKYKLGPDGSYIGSLMKGTIQIVDIPEDLQLQELTKKVVSNNFQFTNATDSIFNKRAKNPIPLYPGAQENTLFLYRKKIEPTMKFLVRSKTGMEMRP